MPSLSKKYPFPLSLNFNTPHEDGYLESGLYFMRAAERLGMPVEKYYGGKVDVVLNVETDNHPFVRGEKFTAYYDLDVFLPRAFDMKKFQSDADVWFTSNMPLYKIRKGLPHFLVPHATDPVLTSKRLKKEYDVVVCGRLDWAYERRRNLARELSQHFKTLVLPPTPTEKYLQAMSLGKLILNCSLSGWDLGRREFDAMALGVSVTDYSKYQNLMGVDGKHFFSYKSKKELIGVVGNLLKDEKRLEELDRISTEHVYKYHTYDVRLQSIYDTIKKLMK